LFWVLVSIGSIVKDGETHEIWVELDGGSLPSDDGNTCAHHTEQSGKHTSKAWEKSTISANSCESQTGLFVGKRWWRREFVDWNELVCDIRQAVGNRGANLVDPSVDRTEEVVEVGHSDENAHGLWSSITGIGKCTCNFALLVEATGIVADASCELLHGILNTWRSE